MVRVKKKYLFLLVALASIPLVVIVFFHAGFEGKIVASYGLVTSYGDIDLS